MNDRRLHFDYKMEITYREPVSRCSFTIKCIPMETTMQHVENYCIRLTPERKFMRGVDSFGNQMIYGNVEGEHDTFSFDISGEVITGVSECDTMKHEAMLGVYRYPYGMTVPGEGILAYFEQIMPEGEQNDFEKGVFLMQRLYQDFRYEKGVTNIATTAEEAWNLGRGVCQDYAHILITLCKLAKIPARYVVGMLMGEGYSHAWVEIFYQGGWYPLDPTNNMIVTDSHIKLGHGRDASDCQINRGLFFGGGGQEQKISVLVEEITN